MTSLQGPLTLPDDVLLVPVRELPEEARAQIDCGEDDFALSRPTGRQGSKIVDAGAADLLRRFREPRTVIEAVILFGRERAADPLEVLEGAYPLLRELVAGGFLRPAGGDGDPAPAAPGVPRWPAGTQVLGGVVLRTLQVLEDTEVALLRRDRQCSVLKIERPPDGEGADRYLRERFEREARLLEHLAGGPVPRLLEHGRLGGCAYLELEHCPGVDAATAAGTHRDQGGEEGRHRLLELCRAIARAYAELHHRGVVHGDVHPRNVLVAADGGVRLIDFGVARPLRPEDGLGAAPERGGVPFYYEPELARAFLDGAPPPPATAAGEQFALAALLDYLVTGAHWRTFSLGRDEMLEEIATARPLSFTERKTVPWPGLEAVLRRALAQDPVDRFPTVAAFAGALEALHADEAPAPPTPSFQPLESLLHRTLARAAPGGRWYEEGSAPGPTASVTYGAAGVALGLLQVAQRRGDPELLALADRWAHRARRQLSSVEACYNPAIEITREVVGESSPYHTASGVWAAQALVARAQADPLGQRRAVEGFLETAARPAVGLDLTLGRSSALLAAGLLLDALPPGELVEPGPLRAFGQRALEEVWAELDRKPEIPRAGIEYLGIAHGWAGFLYATLVWCQVSGAPLPAGVPRRLEELADLALPVGRGLAWPWTLRPDGEPAVMPGWCNGSCGYVFLWTLAHRRTGRGRFLDLALGAGWDSFDSPEPAITLCCGRAGRGYALLNLYRHTGDGAWLERARTVALAAARSGALADEHPHALYKGELGLAVLAADLEQPGESAMPFFEPLGYGGGG